MAVLHYWLDFDDHDDPLAEVDPLEVQRVIAALDELIRTLSDDMIKVYLHAACEDIGNLLGAGESGEDEQDWAEAA